MSDTVKQSSPRNKKIILISVIALLLLIATVITLCLIFKNSDNKHNSDETPNTPEAVAKKFMDAYCSFDSEKMITCYPEFIWSDEKTKEILLLSLQDFLDYAKPYKPAYNSIEMIAPTEEQLAEINQELESYTKIITGLDLSCISEITTAIVSLNLIDDYGASYSDTETLILINYSGKWCVFFPYFL